MLLSAVAYFMSTHFECMLLCSTPPIFEGCGYARLVNHEAGVGWSATQHHVHVYSGGGAS